MKYVINYRALVGSITILSGILSAACIYVGCEAVEYNFDAFSNPVLTLQYAYNHVKAYHFLLLDLFGYYLLLLPVIIYFHQQYKYRSPWTTLFTLSGIAYVFTGAIGASILAAVWPEMMMHYLHATAENRDSIIVVFNAITLLVTKGLWNILEVFMAAIWWIGTGALIFKQYKTMGVLTIVTGVFTLFDAVGNMINSQILTDIGLNVYLVLGILWPIVIGVFLLKKPLSDRTEKTDKDYSVA